MRPLKHRLLKIIVYGVSMKLSYSARPMETVSTEALLVFVQEIKRLDNPGLKKIDKATGGALKTLVRSEEFTGKEAQIATFYRPEGFRAGRIIIVGLGAKDSISPDSFRRATGRASRYKALASSKTVAMLMDGYEKPEYAQAAIEGYILGSYKNLTYKTGNAAKDGNKVAGITFVVGNKTALKTVEMGAARGLILAEGGNLVRDLAATPGNFLTPKIYATKAQQLARKYKFTCKVLDEPAIKKEKMGAFLSVTRGSVEPPRFLILRYNGAAASQKPIVFVGKGITFDSGGISLKPGLNMHEMKQDMTGSAVVLATIVTAARLRVKQNIVVLIPACENMPAGNATKPGDIITSRKGKTVEIINTDAEGRLILADALTYADKFKPQAVIDVATLTGASLYILGYAGAPIMGNSGELLDGIRQASDNTAELVWPLPIWDEQRDLMKSDIADLRNSAGRTSGTICAAAFLENFIGDWPWAHIDIAYMDQEPKGRPYIPRGATGYGIRLLVDLLSNWKKL